MILRRSTSIAAAALTLVLMAAVVSGCSSEDDEVAAEAVNPSASVYAGLPPEVVKERLSDPVFIETLNSAFAPAERAGVVQENVSLAVYCRDVHALYEAWIEQGEQPDYPELSVPEAPAASFIADMSYAEEAVEAAIDSGDPTELKNYLVASETCGTYPVSIGATETMADALAGS